MARDKLLIAEQDLVSGVMSSILLHPLSTSHSLSNLISLLLSSHNLSTNERPIIRLYTALSIQ